MFAPCRQKDVISSTTSSCCTCQKQPHPTDTATCLSLVVLLTEEHASGNATSEQPVRNATQVPRMPRHVKTRGPQRHAVGPVRDMNAHAQTCPHPTTRRESATRTASGDQVGALRVEESRGVSYGWALPVGLGDGKRSGDLEPTRVRW